MQTKRTATRYSLVWAIMAFLYCLWLAPSVSVAQTPFYQGKTIRVVQAREPGGTGDLRVRAAATFLRKYIPGNPTIVQEYMAGGGGRKAANYIYGSARPDGLTIGSMQTALVSHAVLGVTGVQYDVDKLIYLGSPNSSVHYVFLTRREAGLRSLEALRGASRIRIGAQSIGDPIHIAGRLFAYLLGMKDPQFVVGYSGLEVDIALTRGEVDARASVADSVLTRSADWLEKGLMDFHSIIEIPKGDTHPHPRFRELPEIETFAKSERERRLLTMYRAFRAIGNAYVLPPGTPKEQVDTLKEAMRKTFKDPEFHKEYKKLTGEDPMPLGAEVLERTIGELPREPELISLFEKLASAGPLPPR